MRDVLPIDVLAGGCAAVKRRRLFKPAMEVTSADLPFAWRMESLATAEGMACECC